MRPARRSATPMPPGAHTRHAHRPRRARAGGERHRRGARRRDPRRTATLLAPAAGQLPLRRADRAQGRRHGRAGRRARRRGAALAHHHPPWPAHACRRGGPHRGRDHVHPAGRPRRRLRARVPAHGARLRRPRGLRGRDAAARDDRPAPRELAARGGTGLCGDRRDRAHPADGGDRLPPDGVGAGRARARRAALHVRSLVGRRRAAARDRHPGRGPDADGGLRARTGCRATAARPVPCASAARRRSGAARSAGRTSGHARRLGRQASLAAAARPRHRSDPGRCASTSRCGCGAPPRAAAGGGASSAG